MVFYCKGANMRLSTVIKHLTQEYETITKQDVLHIRKPMSFALYQTWRWCDAHEKERCEIKEQI